MTRDDDFLSDARSHHRQSREDRALSIQGWCARNVNVPRGGGPVGYQENLVPYWWHWLRQVRTRIVREPDPQFPDDHLIEQIWICSISQIGKTNGFLYPIIGWTHAVHPRDCGLVMQDDKSLKKARKTKLRPFFDNSPRLRALMPDGQSESERRIGTAAWLLARSTQYFQNGSTANDLRQIDLPLMIWDEHSALPDSAGGEGDPIGLGLARQKSYPTTRLSVGATTPDRIDDAGWRMLCAGSHERLILACAKCGAHWWPDPDLLEAPKGHSPDAIESDDSARLPCRHCGHRYGTDDLNALVLASCREPHWSAAGGWVPGVWELRPDKTQRWTPAANISSDLQRWTAIGRPSGKIRSGWLNGLYSSFTTLGTFLADERRARAGSIEELHTFTNGWRCEPWLGGHDAPGAAEVQRVTVTTRTDYLHGQCPFPATRLLCCFDQQGDQVEGSWFPYVLRAYADDMESWLVEAGIVEGFIGCTNLLRRTWPIGGQLHQVDLATMDTANGQMLVPIRQWCAGDQARRISLSGSGSMGDDKLYSTITATGHPRNRAKLAGLREAFYFNANLFRNALYDRMRGSEGSPRWHISFDAPPFYRESLTSEERVPVEIRMHGRATRSLLWRPAVIVDPNGKERVRTDNHWWDCEVAHVAITTIRGWTTSNPTRKLSVQEWFRRKRQ